MPTIDQIKIRNKAAGRHFFDRGTLRFFQSRILSEVYQGPGGIYFVTSEKGPDRIRRYTVRSFDPETCDVRTAGEFQAFKSASGAKTRARNLATSNQT